MKTFLGYFLLVCISAYSLTTYSQTISLDELYNLSESSKSEQADFLLTKGFKRSFSNEPNIRDNIVYLKQGNRSVEQVCFQDETGITRVIYMTNSSSYYTDLLTIITFDKNWKFAKKEQGTLGESYFYANEKLKSYLELTLTDIGFSKTFVITFARFLQTDID